MKRILVFLLLFLSLCGIAMAQSSEDKRRVEEEKRHNLATSESYQLTFKDVPPPDTGSDQSVYFSKLLSKKTAALSDAYQTIVFLVGKDGQLGGTEACFNFLKEEGIIPKNITAGADHNAPLRKGAAAYMFAKVMDIKGGITLRLFGLNQRYAFRELVYQQIMYPGNVDDIMSGQELILTVTHAADYLAQRQQEQKGVQINILDKIWGTRP